MRLVVAASRHTLLNSRRFFSLKPPSEHLLEGVRKLDKLAGALKAIDQRSAEQAAAQAREGILRQQKILLGFLTTGGVVTTAWFYWLPNTESISASVLNKSDQSTLGVLRAEIARLEEKYANSLSGYRFTIWLSQGPAHYRKIVALRAVEKELDPYLGGSGECVSTSASEALKAAYDDYPESEDRVFSEKFLKPEGCVGSFQRCKK